jgi:hypothetical protein
MSGDAEDSQNTTSRMHLKMSEELGTMHTFWRVLLLGWWWPVSPMLVFLPDVSTSPGNYLWIFVCFSKEALSVIPHSTETPVTLNICSGTRAEWNKTGLANTHSKGLAKSVKQRTTDCSVRIQLPAKTRILLFSTAFVPIIRITVALTRGAKLITYICQCLCEQWWSCTFTP